MVTGVLLIVGGSLALFASVLTSFVSVIFLGAILLVVGALEAIAAVRVRHSSQFLAYLFAGVLAIVVGGLFLYAPLASLASITLMIAGYVFAGGLFRGITSIADRYPHWGWDVGYAIVALVIGAFLVATWPASSLWLLGTVVAIEIIIRGSTLIAAAG